MLPTCHAYTTGQNQSEPVSTNYRCWCKALKSHCLSKIGKFRSTVIQPVPNTVLGSPKLLHGYSHKQHHLELIKIFSIMYRLIKILIWKYTMKSWQDRAISGCEGTRRWKKKRHKQVWRPQAGVKGNIWCKQVQRHKELQRALIGA